MTDTRTPDEIERSIEKERAQLGHTVDELQDRFSADNILRELGRGLSDHGQDIGNAITESVKRNPVALALTGVGLVWLMSGRSWQQDKHAIASTGSDVAAAARTRVGQARDYARERVGSGAGYVGGYDDAEAYVSSVRRTHPSESHGGGINRTYSDPERPSASMADRAGDGVLTDGRGLYRRDVQDDWLYADDDDYWAGFEDDIDDEDDTPGMGDRISDAAASVGEQARDTADTVSGRASAVGHNVKSSAATMRDSAAHRARRIRRRLARGTESLADDARERVIAARWSAVKARRAAARRARSGVDTATKFYEDNPLVVGGLAIAAGAILAGTLPRTRQEDDLMGKQSDRYYDRAERMLEAEWGKAKQVADRAAASAQEVLDEERAKIDDQAPGDKSAAEHVADEVRSGVNRVADDTKKEAEKQKLGQPSTS